MDFSADFEALLGELPAILASDNMDCPPNSVSPTQAQSLARIGFGRHAQQSSWTSQHANVIADLRAGDYSDESLSVHGQAAPTWAAFSCLVYGALLGKFQARLVSESEFTIAQAQLPGFMYLRSPQLAALPNEPGKA